MKRNLEEYDIKLFDLEEGTNRFRFRMGQDFFDGFGTMEFDKADMQADVEVIKTGNLMEIRVQTAGHVELPDDRTGEAYAQKLHGNLNTLLRYGPEYNDDDENLIVIPFQTPHFNLAQLIYESVLLSIPMKHLDPDYTPEEPAPEPLHEEIDPRWSKLKSLLKNDKNQ